MPENDLDKACRFAAKLDAVAFLVWILNVPPDQFRFREWLDPRKISLPGEPDRTGDTVALVENVAQGGVPWAIAIEFQGDPHSMMFSRALIYLASVWSGSKPDEERGSRYQVGFVVVNLTGTGRTGREMSWPEAGMNLNLKVVERNLELESADELLSSIEAGKLSRCLLVWVPLMRGADEALTVTRLKALAEGESDYRRKAEYATRALVFAEKAQRLVLWKEELKGWNMTTAWIFDQFRAEGRVESTRELVLRLGAKKFASEPPLEATKAINSLSDLPSLEQLAERVLTVENWDELLQGVG